MKPIASNDRIKPSDLILRRPRSSRGRLEGWPRARSRLWPSFEMRASFDKLRSALLRTRLMDEFVPWKRCTSRSLRLDALLVDELRPVPDFALKPSSQRWSRGEIRCDVEVCQPFAHICVGHDGGAR